MSDVDIDHLRGWIGREETAGDVVTPGLVDRFRATLGRWLAPGDGVPNGLHWCLAPPAAARDALGPDGHPARGGFLPPVPLPNRMWAGGEVAFHRPLAAEGPVRRVSRIAGVERKDGRSGPLVFVVVEHRVEAGDGLSVEERQDIVYRPATARRSAPFDPPPAPEGAFVGDPVTLFRYSALTFNGHRIHYDHPYVTGEEGYPGLVVHGPLQATILMHRAAALAGTPAIRFRYRGLAPLIAGEPVRIEDGEGAVRLRKPDGTVTFEASFDPLERRS